LPNLPTPNVAKRLHKTQARNRVFPCVRDFIFLGIPNRRFDLAQAQVQAQIPAFLAEAHADAEAQAQAQEPREQVGEVQVGNVNSANSPVVVS
jgi:hypothetical protein